MRASIKAEYPHAPYSQQLGNLLTYAWHCLPLMVSVESVVKVIFVNPVRNFSGALNPVGIILKSNPVAATGPEGLWPGGSSGALFLTG